MSHRPSDLEQRIDWTRSFRCATDKAVLKALARWYAWRADGEHVRPSIPALAVKSGVPRRSVERALRRLETGGWIQVTARRHREPTTYRIVLARLAIADPDELTLTARVADKIALDRHSGGQEPSGGQENGPDFDKVADHSTAAAVRTEIRTPAAASTEDRHSGGQPLPPDVRRFLDWWAVLFPFYNHDAQPTVPREADAAVVGDLLRGRTVERLQDMAIRLWTLEADGDPGSPGSWIARTDRSLRVLRHKAAFLDRAVAAPQQLSFGPLDAPLSRRELDEAETIRTRAYGRCPHQPRCATAADCVREIALARRVG